MLVVSRFFLNQIRNDKNSRMRYNIKSNENTAVIKKFMGTIFKIKNHNEYQINVCCHNWTKQDVTEAFEFMYQICSDFFLNLNDKKILKQNLIFTRILDFYFPWN